MNEPELKSAWMHRLRRAIALNHKCWWFEWLNRTGDAVLHPRFEVHSCN